jgi:hypothetical protein
VAQPINHRGSVNKTDFTPSNRSECDLTNFLTNFLEQRGHRWPKQDVDHVCAEFGYGECSDALKNVIARGLRNGKGCDPFHVQHIEASTAAVKISEPPFLTRLGNITKAAALRR